MYIVVILYLWEIQDPLQVPQLTDVQVPYINDIVFVYTLNISALLMISNIT
jgi:hypothetical protein